MKPLNSKPDWADCSNKLKAIRKKKEPTMMDRLLSIEKSLKEKKS